MPQTKREDARPRKSSRVQSPSKVVSTTTQLHASQSHPGVSQEKLKLTLTVPKNFPALLNALAKFHGYTPESYMLEALCSMMLCDSENFDKDASEILAAIRGGAK